MGDEQATVTIVGAGPAGLAAAILLAEQGVRSIILERRAHEARAPKAHVVNPRTLEILRAANVDLAAMRASASPEAECDTARFLTRLSGRLLGTVPFERQCRADTAATPTPFLNIDQPAFEEHLLREVERRPQIELRRGHAWRSCEQTSQAVASTVEGPQGPYRLTSPYLLAADGASSDVREHLQIPMEGDAAVMPLNMIHFEADLRPLLAERPGMLHWVFRPQGMGVFIAYDMGRNWVYNHIMPPGDETALSHEAARELLDAAIGAPVPYTIRHVSPWTMTAQVAARYRAGRVFLLGDAAHRFPPTGGLGLNTGVQDAHNLVWKLAAVLHGWADEAILQTYEEERRPIAKLNTDQSLHNALKFPDLIDALTFPGDDPTDAAIDAWLAEGDHKTRIDRAVADQVEHHNMPGLHLGFAYSDGWRPTEVSRYAPCADVGHRLPHTPVTIGEQSRSSLDLLDPKGFTLLAGPAGSLWRTARASRAPLKVVLLEAGQASAAWLGLTGLDGDTALLVRPDGHVSARLSRSGSSTQGAALAAIDAAAYARPPLPAEPNL